ncbi:MAG: serine/threonine protein kinase, partial [Planctomycetes bacterium]|nr:serine/threonine protein kinase [Planctomycetota bacterium]
MSRTPEGKRLGPYVVEREIARGGQGVVLIARHAETGGRVALKLLLDPTPQRVGRFRQEAQVLARLQHPNLLRVNDLGEHGGVPFLAMEFVEGRSLEQLFDEEGVQSEDWIKQTLGEVASALDYCHQSGLVHRDVKPANVLVEAGTGRIVLVDFGLIKRDPDKLKLSTLDSGSRLSKTGELRGTPAYMSPEQISHTRYGEVGPITDVYGLGGLLYYLLCGRSPFQADSLPSLLVKVLGTNPVSPKAINPSAPAGLAQLALRALSKEQSRRPASAREFSDALRGGTPSAATGKPRSRIPLLLSASLNLVLLLGLGAVVLSPPTVATLSWEEAFTRARANVLTPEDLAALEGRSDDASRWLPYLRVQASEEAKGVSDLPEGPERDLLAAEAATARGTREAYEEALSLLATGAGAALPWRP